MQVRKGVQEEVLTEVFKQGHARIHVFLKYVLGMQPGGREVTNKCCLTGGRQNFDVAKGTEEPSSIEAGEGDAGHLSDANHQTRGTRQPPGTLSLQDTHENEFYKSTNVTGNFFMGHFFCCPTQTEK